MLLGAATAVIALARRGRARTVPGGIVIGHTGAYDTFSRLVLGSLFGPIAADVATLAPPGARVLEVGCGPGHLSIRLARGHGLEVTGLDLDAAMIERARANADRAADALERRPSFLVGDVAALPFADGCLDVVVSTMSMHHWADPTAGLAEIGRVLRPDGRALIWDFRPGAVPLHRHTPDPVEPAKHSPLHLVSATRWRWPWRFSLLERIELSRIDGASAHPT
jgi:SAM-dependent methyltransferase